MTTEKNPSNQEQIVDRTTFMQYRPTLLQFVSLVVLAAPTLAADESNFIRIKPFSGMSLEVPKTWKAVDDETKAQAATVIEALFDSSGLRSGAAPKPSGMFSARLPSQDVDVSVTIIAEPGSASQRQVDSLTEDQLRALGEREQKTLRETIEPMQLRLISFSGMRRQVVGGKTALTYEVRTSDANGQQRVIANMIFHLGDRKFTVTTSWPLSGTDLWRVVFEKITSSLRFD